MKWGKFLVLVSLVAWLLGCSSNNSGVAITVTPSSATVVLSGNQQFTATVTGNSNENVTWYVNNIAGGNSTVGTISTVGLYTAPAVLPTPDTVTIEAISQANTGATASATVTLDTGIRVTIAPQAPTVGTSETLTFVATVTGTSNTEVTWSVDGAVNGNPTVGTIDDNGNFTAPPAVPNPAIITVTATSVADDTKVGSSSVTIVLAVDPTLGQIDPPTAAQGSVFQDLYLTGTNFFSTSTVLANGAPLTTTFISTTVLRARVIDQMLTSAGSVSIVVQRQNGGTSIPIPLVVNSVRPTIVSSIPVSASQGSPNFTVGLYGGFFGTASSPIVTAEYNGQARTVSPANTRQTNVVLQGASDAAEAGLFPLVLRNSGVAAGLPAIATTNVAIEPSPGSIQLTPVNTITVGAQPTAIAVNTATDQAVVANRGDNTVSVINLATDAVTTVPVGTAPTGVAVDNVRNIAAVVNNGSNTISVVSLGATPSVIGTLSLPAATTGYSIGLNPLSGRALVANVSTNVATVVDLSTPAAPAVLGTVIISTGLSPAVAIDPRLNWAIVTPGGSGTISIVNLGRPPGPGDIGLAPFVVATASLTTSIQGIAINSETEQTILTDPLNLSESNFSLLDQTVTTIKLDKGEVAAAANPLANIAVTVNTNSNMATVIDMRTLLSLAVIPVGAGPQAVAIDPVTNQAFVANTGSSPGTVSILALGALRPLHITQISPTVTFTPSAACAGAPPFAMQVIGSGFSSSSAVRLNETPLPAASVTFVSARQLTASVPACLVNSPQLVAVDVANTDGTVSNEELLYVEQAIPVGNAPQGVGLDSERQLAIVTNAGDGTITIVNLNTGLSGSALSVGAQPTAVAVLSRLGLAVVTDFGNNTAAIVDLVTQQVTGFVNVGSGPLGVAIQPDTADAIVANSVSNTVSIFPINSVSPPTASSVTVDQAPQAVAVDPVDDIAAVVNATDNTVVMINLMTNTLAGRILGMQDPLGVTFDPVSINFIALNAAQNNLVIINPTTLFTTPVRIGINPASIDYNFQTGTLVTANYQSHTLTVMDYQNQVVKAVVSVDNSTQFGLAINPSSNTALVVDTANNRLLIVPLPR